MRDVDELAATSYLGSKDIRDARDARDSGRELIECSDGEALGHEGTEPMAALVSIDARLLLILSRGVST